MKEPLLLGEVSVDHLVGVKALRKRVLHRWDDQMSLLKPLSREKSCIINNYVEEQVSSIGDDAGDVQELRRDPEVLQSGTV